MNRRVNIGSYLIGWVPLLLLPSFYHHYFPHLCTWGGALILTDDQTWTRYGPYWYFDESIPILAILGHGGKALEEMYGRK
jgi:hypothetical protein